MKSILSFLIILIPGLACIHLSGCSKKPSSQPSSSPTPYALQIPFHFSSLLNVPADNPMTVEGVALGRYLFYDGRVSGRAEPDSMMSCSTCHIQANAFVCGINHPKFTGGHPFGITGIKTPHYILPLINLVWNGDGYLWNGAVSNNNPDPARRTLEDIIGIVVYAPSEMCSDTIRSKALIQSVKGYPELFKGAFGNSLVTFRNISRAIAQFIRTLISANSKFDQFLQGRTNLSVEERNGFVLFITEQGADCFHCHGGDANPLFTTNLCYNNGKDSVFTDPFDRYAVTSNPADIGAYKAPTLRNLVFRAPYMHDGRFKSIDEVISFYSSGLVWSPSISPLMHHISTHGVQLTPSQKSELKAFLLTLTDSSFVTNPAYAKPDKFPDQ